jgi:hypothetical protein
MISPVVVISPRLPFPDLDIFRGGDKHNVPSDAAVVVISPTLPFTALEIFFCGDECNCRSDGVPSLLRFNGLSLLRACCFVALSFVLPFFPSYFLDTDLVLAPFVDSSLFFAGFFFGELFAMMVEDDASDFAAIIFRRVGRSRPVTFNRSAFLGTWTTDGCVSLLFAGLRRLARIRSISFPRCFTGCIFPRE